MEKLREMVIKMAAADQKKALLSSQVAHIEQQLNTAFPAGLHTPNHPPYAAMIYKAITDLNEEGGSAEESISQYIKSKYINDLGFGHKSFLRQNLRKLSDKGFLVFSTAANGYMIGSFTAAPVGKWTKRKPRVDNSSDSNRNTERKRRKPNDEALAQLCNAVTTDLSLAREIRRLDKKLIPEKGQGFVKRKKKDMIKWMVNAFSERLPEEKSKEQDMRIIINNNNNNGNQMTELKHPSFLQGLVETKFLDECEVHLDCDNRIRNSYCLDCINGALCKSCRTSHEDHHVIKISRTMWENSVPASEINKYIDISGIQTHNVANRDFVSLKRTVQSRHCKHFTAACVICNRYLPHSFNLCSLKCKIQHHLASCMPYPDN